jgi:7,8-dihydropterin-6-yl-methyl-4-(beta-D-ribofuranosyl)aminobenzene 5'-phosphate synthase
LRVNPGVKIYAPQDVALLTGPVPPGFLKADPSLPSQLRYFGGKPPRQVKVGSPWGPGNFAAVKKSEEIFPGIQVITTQSRKLGTLEMNEVSLVIRTPKGLAVVVGCSHPGVERILKNAAKIDSRFYTVVGGFHLVLTPRSEVERVAGVLHDDLKLERVAPGHCTSELGFAVFRDHFKDRFDQAGLGAVITLP